MLGVHAIPMSRTKDLQGFMRDMAEQIRSVHLQLYGSEFITEYDRLINQLFLGSFSETMVKIRSGDEPAVEFGLAFVEIRPYYYGSQYQRTKLIRMLKHAKLSPAQAERLRNVLELEHEKKLKSPQATQRKFFGELKQKTRKRNPSS